MYCLRSFAVLLVLPYPSVPPLLNILFLAAFVLAKRPCIYCTILLIALFSATCYWDITPSDWVSSSAGDGSSSRKALRRCWCDLNGGKLLSPRILSDDATKRSIIGDTSKGGGAFARLTGLASNATSAAVDGIESSIGVNSSISNATLKTVSREQGKQHHSLGYWAITRASGWIDSLSKGFTEPALGFKIQL